MALTLSERARDLLAATTINAQLILEIDGFDGYIFGAVDVGKLARIGEDNLTIGEFKIGGIITDSRSRPWISLEGTDVKTTQQVFPDKGGTSSVSALQITLIDKDDTLSQIFSPGEIVDDLLGQKAKVYFGFQDGAFPEDAITLLNGVVTQHDFQAGRVKLQISSAEELKRQEIFSKVTTELDGAIDASTTSVKVVDPTGLLIPEDILIATAIRVEDEIITYTGYDGAGNLSGVTRGAFDSIPASHSDLETAESFMVIEGGAIELALKLMLSGEVPNFAEGVAIQKIVRQNASTTVDNAIFFNISDIQSKYGLVEGDLITVSGAANGANNFSDRIIVDFGLWEGGSFIVVDGAPLVIETPTNATMDIKSKYNVLSQVGCGMDPTQVDVPRHELWDDLLGTSFPNYRIYIRDSIKAKDLIDLELYHSTGLYGLPRDGGKASLNMSIPPLSLEQTVVLDSSNVIGAEKLSIKRSTSKFFYNAVAISYDEDSVKEDFYRKAEVQVSETSFNRIKVRRRPLIIKSKGLRSGIDASQVAPILARRLLNRYRFGAERVERVRVLFKVGMTLECGDNIIWNPGDMKMTDIQEASRTFKPRLMEVINVQKNYSKAEVVLDLLDSKFGLLSRIGTYSCSSVIGEGSTTNTIQTTRTLGTPTYKLERNYKWADYIGEVIRVRDEDFTVAEESVLVGFDPLNENGIVVEPDLSFAPTAGMIVECPRYSGQAITKAVWKDKHCFFSPTRNVTGGTSDTEFTVDDISVFYIGSPIRVHDEDYNTDSIEVEDLVVENIVGSTITTNKSIGFTPVAGYQVDAIGFIDDEGVPYNYI